MADMRSDLVPPGRRAGEADQSGNSHSSAASTPDEASADQQKPERNPAWLVLEILFITVLVFFWL